MHIRRYHPRDLPGVRRVAFETGFFGEPMSQILDDRSLFERSLRCYLRASEHASYVLEERGRVVGYAIASTRDVQLCVALTTVLGLLLDLLRFPLLTAKDRRYLLGRGVNAWRAIRGDERNFRTPRGPRLHINILPSHRRGGVGSLLLDIVANDLRARGRDTMHANSYQTARNPTDAFWKRNGFVEFSRVRSSAWKASIGDEPVDFVCYVRAV